MGRGCPLPSRLQSIGSGKALRKLPQWVGFKPSYPGYKGILVNAKTLLVENFSFFSARKKG